jgi:GNAT superfamily N-acetyltransferase
MPRVRVVVTFMRQDRRYAGPVLPADVSLVKLAACSVAFYRYLYDTVGGPYLWWLRRTMPDRELTSLLAHPGVAIYVLYRGGEPIGFFEIDSMPPHGTNISYFGLMRQAIGQGLGPAFLQAACDAAWDTHPRMVTVNTCTADHPRALKTYLHAGFQIVRQMPENWDIPDHLGMTVPRHLVV